MQTNDELLELQREIEEECRKLRGKRGSDATTEWLTGKIANTFGPYIADLAAHIRLLRDQVAEAVIDLDARVSDLEGESVVLSEDEAKLALDVVDAARRTCATLVSMHEAMADGGNVERLRELLQTVPLDWLSSTAADAERAFSILTDAMSSEEEEEQEAGDGSAASEQEAAS